MKIEMGEWLCYSYLRHVQRCWLVQANWKASEHWEKYLSNDELEDAFRSMRQTFDLGGNVFKGTKDCSQFLRQAEIDAVGIGQNGSIHAIDVAFHEAGLNYSGGVGNRVLKKLLRTVLVLMAYHPREVKRHIYFVSPKVHRAAQQPLEDIFGRLQDEYPAIEWHLFTNEVFAQEMLTPTLELGKSVADTSELFLRSVKLMELGGLSTSNIESPTPRHERSEGAKSPESVEGILTDTEAGQECSRRGHARVAQLCRQALTSSGFSVEPLAGDDDADFLVGSEGGASYKRVRAISRLEIRERLIGEDLYVSFETNGNWYLVPHDHLVEIAGNTTPWLETDSWRLQGWYSSPNPSRIMLDHLADFAL